jgi:gluconolactonase
MNSPLRIKALLAALLPLLWASAARSQVVAKAPQDLALGNPTAIVDLDDADALPLLQGAVRYADVRIEEATLRGPGPDLRPSGAANRTNDVSPRPGMGFDRAHWVKLTPGSLKERRGRGKLSFAWYRFDLTLPQTIGATAVQGSTVVFEVVVDDYAEVWVEGALSPVLGQSGGTLIKGFNAPNRVVLTRNAKPGQHFDVAVFAANGPLSGSPNNFLWLRSATVELHPAAALPTAGDVERLDPGLDTIVPSGARVEKIADGFQFLEGPVWHPDGYLLFSDPNANTMYRWDPAGGVSVYRTKSGYRGADIGEYHQPGSNGLTLDGSGRLTIDEHGNRRVVRMEPTGAITVLADRYQGKRLNSPNDLVYRSDGALYFTDPPFGLPRFYEDPRKELGFSGVFCVRDGQVILASDELKGPNGLAFTPDEKFLYVDNWDEQRKVILKYPVNGDCTLGRPETFADLTSVKGEQAFDGLKVDQGGNVFAAGPGGVLVFAPDGRRLGTIRAEQQPANLAWGDADGRTLYLAARTGLYRIRLSIPGIRPPLAPRS